MNMEYVLEQLKNLLAIDSPSGYTKEVTDYLLNEFEKLGVPAYRTVKGGVIADLGGEDADNAVFVESHVDTLGAVMGVGVKDGVFHITGHAPFWRGPCLPARCRCRPAPAPPDTATGTAAPH